MKQFYILLFALFLLPLLSLAQSNYKPGYVVTLKGDTVHGFIDYQDWDTNPTAISFKTLITDRKAQQFTINNINFFNVNELATYQKYICSVSLDETNTSHLSSGRDSSYKIDTVFLKILQKGKNVALYSYTDGLKTRFYVSEAPDYTPAELIYRLYYDLSAQGSKTVVENTYQKQLFALGAKYNALDDKLMVMLGNTFGYYDKDELLKIFSRINNISKTEFDKKYSSHSKVRFYLSTSVNISHTSSNEGSSYTAGGGVPYSSYLPAAGIGVDLVPDPLGGRAEFRFDLSVLPAQLKSQYQLKVSPYTEAQASYNQLGMFFTPQALYNLYNADNFKFYLGFGLALAYFNYSKPYFQSRSFDPSFPDQPYEFNHLDNAFLFKAGFRIHKNWEIYFNYFTGAATTGGGYFQLSNQNTQAGVSYFLGK